MRGLDGQILRDLAEEVELIELRQHRRCLQNTGLQNTGEYLSPGEPILGSLDLREKTGGGKKGKKKEVIERESTADTRSKKDDGVSPHKAVPKKLFIFFVVIL